MDGAPLASVIREQLKGVTGLASLQLQNHIYGCFIIMEDIAQQTVTLTGNQLVGSNVILSLDQDQDFDRIGLQFGFVMNSKLGLASVNPNYQAEWCKIFRELSSIEQVDTLEDAIIEVIHESVSTEDAYFSHALDTGSLPQEWLTKIIGLLNPSETTATDDPQPSAIGLANIEKNRPIKKGRLATTRRSKPAPVKAPLATTRRRK